MATTLATSTPAVLDNIWKSALGNLELYTTTPGTDPAFSGYADAQVIPTVVYADNSLTVTCPTTMFIQNGATGGQVSGFDFKISDPVGTSGMLPTGPNAQSAATLSLTGDSYGVGLTLEVQYTPQTVAASLPVTLPGPFLTGAASTPFVGTGSAFGVSGSSGNGAANASATAELRRGGTSSAFGSGTVVATGVAGPITRASDGVVRVDYTFTFPAAETCDTLVLIAGGSHETSTPFAYTAVQAGQQAVVRVTSTAVQYA